MHVLWHKNANTLAKEYNCFAKGMLTPVLGHYYALICYIYAVSMHNACLLLKKHALRLSVFTKKLNFVARLYKKKDNSTINNILFN